MGIVSYSLATASGRTASEYSSQCDCMVGHQLTVCSPASKRLGDFGMKGGGYSRDSRGLCMYVLQH